MEELEQTKAKRVTIPKRVKRYGIAYYSNVNGWENSTRFHTTPEGAIEDFIRVHKSYEDSDYFPKFYTVFELDLPIPIYSQSNNRHIDIK